MANKFTITLLNKNDTGNYVFFQTLPEMTQDSGPIDKIFANAWISQGCAKGGSIVINTTRDFNAWVGSIKKPAGIGAVVTGGKALPVILGTKDKKGGTFNVTYTKKIVDLEPTGAAASPSAFELNTSEFTAADNILVGMAKPDPNNFDTMMPSALINATGSMKITIVPKNDYWVVRADFEVGQIFDYTSISKSAAKVAFEDNLGSTKAIVTNEAGGTWSVQYA